MTMWNKKSNNNDKNQSFSESDLTDPYRLSRFCITHPHEYLSIDDLNLFRRKKYPSGFHTKITVYPQTNDGPGLPFYSLESEYSWQFKNRYFRLKPSLLRRSTSLHLDGLMQNKSEHQEQFQVYTLADYKLSHGSLIKKAENLFLSGIINMEPEYRSSYISYPMVNRTSKILPREAFHLFSEATDKNPKHEEGKDTIAPSEYKEQFVRFPIERARSIPQISHLKIQGEFGGVPEYKDSFKTYETYSKSAPIKKGDTLRMSSAQEVDAMPEYRTKFRNPTEVVSKGKLLKIDSHIHACGQISKDLPEYDESFRDSQIKQMPERGKCREPYLRLKGKIEFNPEYKNTFLDFPRSRPVTRKPASTLLLSNPLSTSKTTSIKNLKHAQHSNLKTCSTSVCTNNEASSSDIIVTPEYRRANYQYQMRERTPVRNASHSKGGDFEVGLETKTKFLSSLTERKSSHVSTDMAGKQKRRILCNRHKSNEHQQGATSVRVIPCATKNVPKFGRRASVLPNSSNFGASISDRATSDNTFVVLNEPYKQSHWTKKSWYES
ncbi:uncharacterized protein LOC105221461 isoform X1 [Zeugodacus cucurbitae]|uniref:uncharacterized protein LOC105221461 isoform X1 n=1 Tax=Zeugodacus cucurbitae TaxID=28588 RepID=UPI0005968F00|nr:uncharacterized protein LOC105221461 isoform X1 [Zeugodacus cucurbitae]